MCLVYLLAGGGSSGRGVLGSGVRGCGVAGLGVTGIVAGRLGGSRPLGGRHSSVSSGISS